jgi:hypothetical protein
MNITMKKYFEEVKKRIYPILIFIMLVSTIQFAYNKFQKEKYDIDFKVNLYDIRVLYSILDLNFDRESQINNLIYKFIKAINEEIPELQKLRCVYKNDIFHCTKDRITTNSANNIFIKNSIEKLMRSKLENLFVIELKFLDTKIQSIENRLKNIYDSYNEVMDEIKESTSNLEIDTVYESILRKMRQAEFDLTSQINSLKDLKLSLSEFQVNSAKTEIVTIFKKRQLKSNYYLTISVSLILALLLVFLSIKEEEKY